MRGVVEVTCPECGDTRKIIEKGGERECGECGHIYAVEEAIEA